MQDTTIQKFVVFDFDGTILEGHSPVMLVKSLLTKRVMPICTVLAIGWWALRYKLRLPHEQSEVREKIFDLFKDLPADEVDKMMEHLYASEISRWLRKDALEVIHIYQDMGIPVVLVSASFEAIVKRAAVELGAFAQLSTRMKIVNNCYTGEVLGTPVEGEEKLRAFERYANDACGEGNWELVAAYGDHHSDVPLLRSAHRPVAVTPDRRLKRIAESRHWEIVHWS
ncbi:MAG: haloacid dehalogenase-like hydrolase [Actinobacteria bacterium]|nr:haloacid dehalogenase-like hydrolase [Actinomycetota bacterium]